MFVRTLLIGLAIAAVLSSTAAAQCGSIRRVAPVSLARQITPIISTSPGDNSVSSVASLTDMARQPIDHVESRYQSCESHRLQSQQWAMKQDPARRKAAWPTTPAKQWTDEELAASKFQGARGLWQAGKSDAARRWLEAVLRDYSHTPTAERARIALTRL
jgi:hypothetical protein